MPFSKTPPPASSAADFAEQLLRSQAQSLTTNSPNSPVPPRRSSESLLSILERITAILDEDDEDFDDISIDWRILAIHTAIPTIHIPSNEHSKPGWRDSTHNEKL